MAFSLPAGTELIGSLIGDYTPGGITTIYGSAASGKTTFCCHASLECARLGYKTLFVDTENGFKTERVRQLRGYEERLLENLLVLKIGSFREQCEKIPHLFELAKKDSVRLVVIDSISNFYRIMLNQDPRSTNKEMVEQLRTMKHIGRDLGKVVILTTQVYANLSGDTGISPVGGELIKKMSDTLIELNQNHNRWAKLLKPKDSPNHNLELAYEILEEGISLFAGHNSVKNLL